MPLTAFRPWQGLTLTTMKISEDKLKEGRELAKKHGFKKLFVNEKGEFFTNPSYASMSVNYDKEKFAEVPLNSDQSQSTEKGTNDLGKAADVIAALEAATEAEVVEAILKAETEGKNRKSVIEAGVKILAGFKEVKDSKEVKDLNDGQGDETTKKAE